jgi:hypothetical protein
VTREKQIADELKEEMAALNRRIARHPWEYAGMHQEQGTNPMTYIVRFKCPRCGMTMEQQAVVEQETLFDEWQEYRENKGDEEE